MSTFQKVIICGFLGADPETKHFDNGGSITNFSVATTERWKDKTTGERKELTEWHRISANGKLGTNIEEFFGKGMRIMIEGKLRTRKWQDQNGNDRYATEIRAEGFNFMDSKAQSGANQAQQTTTQTQTTDPIAGSGAGDNDDLPF